MKKLLLILSLLFVSSAFAETGIQCPNGVVLTVSNDARKIMVKVRGQSTRWIYVKYEHAFFLQLMEYGNGTGDYPNKVQANFWTQKSGYDSYYFDLVRMIPGRKTMVEKAFLDALQNKVISSEMLTCMAYEK